MQAQYLWHMGLAAPRHVESSRPGAELMALHPQVDSYALYHQGSPRCDFLIPVSMLELPTLGVSGWSVCTSHNHLLTYPASSQEHFRYLSALPAFCKTVRIRF